MCHHDETTENSSPLKTKVMHSFEFQERFQWQSKTALLPIDHETWDFLSNEQTKVMRSSLQNLLSLNPRCSTLNCGFATAVFTYMSQLKSVPAVGSAEFGHCILPHKISTDETMHVYMGDSQSISDAQTIHDFKPESSFFVCRPDNGVICEVYNPNIPLTYLTTGNMCMPHPEPMTGEEFDVIKQTNTEPHLDHKYIIVRHWRVFHEHDQK